MPGKSVLVGESRAWHDRWRMTAYRGGAHDELCTDCREPTGDVCRSCRVPACSRHQVRYGLCPRCDGELGARLEALGPPPSANGLSVAALTAILAAVGIVVVTLIGVLANGAVGAGALVRGFLICVGSSLAGAVAIKIMRGRGYEAWHRRHERILAEILDRNRR